MAEIKNSGTWGTRSLVWFFTILLTAFLYSLLGFVLTDIGNIEGPNYASLEEQMMGPKTKGEFDAIEKEIVSLNRQIKDQQAEHAALQLSTATSQTTMNQLLEFQKLSIQNGGAPSEQEREALAESEVLFLKNQKESQRLNDEIANLEKELRKANEERQSIQTKLADLRIPIHSKYQAQLEKHYLKIAMYKLSVLLPLLLITAFLYIKYRSSAFRMLIYALGIALLIKVGFVMHDYFPARYFKYILIATMIVLTLRILVYLLGSISHPKREWLLKQYREAYESFMCPMCDHPIRRGPLKFMSWTRRSIRKWTNVVSSDEKEEPYTCPACTTQLYSECPKCHGIRHTLLPACTHCGTVHDISEVSPS